jgi:hypothetical protein
VAVTVLMPRGRQKLRGFCTQKVGCDYLALRHDSCDDSSQDHLQVLQTFFQQKEIVFFFGGRGKSLVEMSWLWFQ